MTEDTVHVGPTLFWQAATRPKPEVGDRFKAGDGEHEILEVIPDEPDGGYLLETKLVRPRATPRK